MNLRAIVLNWYGPYSLLDVCEDFGDKGVYLFTGQSKYQRELDIPYCGITEQAFCYRLQSHEHRDSIKNLKVWLGYVAYPKRVKREHLELAESAIIYYLQPRLPKLKKAYPPEPVVLVSYWFKQDENPRIRKPPILKRIPDVISWDGTHWRTGDLRVESEY